MIYFITSIVQNLDLKGISSLAGYQVSPSFNYSEFYKLLAKNPD
ncbi:45886_t:CDS:2 [Gigaspora margarita]|uniref:45886_t:CDS:1 n=1 Tax=Gigaspora margarita TaxID=4874 RepID=A0ABN7V0C5_GIGMA|nr:45886_t:CDS:2 [Gigaspora margarita]